MPFDTCANCGKIFGRNGVLRLCAACSLSDQARYAVVRDHIRSNGGQTVAQIAHATGVSIAEIELFRAAGTLISRTPIDPTLGS